MRVGERCWRHAESAQDFPTERSQMKKLVCARQSCFNINKIPANLRPRKVDFVFLIRWSVGSSSVPRFCRGAGSGLNLIIVSYFGEFQVVLRVLRTSMPVQASVCP